MEEAHSSDEEEQKNDNITDNPAILDKYKAAAKIADLVMGKVKDSCIIGAIIPDICKKGDMLILDEVKKIYGNKKNKKMEKGIAFPTCISCNEICGHFSPLKDEEGAVLLLKEGDVAKIDLGVHVDGYISQVAQTIVVGDAAVEGKKADLITGCKKGLDAGMRMITKDNTNKKVTELVNKVVKNYSVCPVQGVLSHKVKKHLIDGNDCILSIETPEHRVPEYTFQTDDVLVLDVIVSTGEGKPRESEFRTTVYKRALETTYSLKLKHSRAFFKEVSQKYPTLPFSIGGFEDTMTAKVGVKECVTHELLQQYPVLTEKAGEIVAQFKATVVILQSGPALLNNIPFDDHRYNSKLKIEDQELIDILAISLEKKDKKKKKMKVKKDEQKEEEKKEEEEVAPKKEEPKVEETK